MKFDNLKYYNRALSIYPLFLLRSFDLERIHIAWFNAWKNSKSIEL